MEVGGQRHSPAALPPGKWPSTHFTGGCVGLRSEEVRETSPRQGFDPRTVDPLGIHYAEYSIPALED
jgi:hypothetical protein